jgi:hypothetical protein
MSFMQTVKAMTFKELVLAMVAGLRHRWVRVEMSSFGGVDRDGVCVGCAATNLICQLRGEVIPSSSIYNYVRRAQFVECDSHFLEKFETAIDQLRCQRITMFNSVVRPLGLPTIPDGWSPGGYIRNDFTEECLQSWEKSVEHLPS